MLANHIRTANCYPAPVPHGVLLVDDDEATRGVLRFGLERHGFRVWDAADGARAVDLYRGHAPEIAVVLLDVHMPRLDGPQTLAALKRHNPDVPVCFMSGDLGESAPDELLRLGARYLFPKPLLMSELAEQLHEIVATCDRAPAPQPAEACAV